MRYLLDAALVLAGLAGLRAFYLVVSVPPGQDGTFNAGLEILLWTIVQWLLLAIVLACCAGIGGFRGWGLQGASGVFLILMAYAAVLLLALLPIGITMEFNAAAKWGIDQVGAARLAAFGLPLALALCAAWFINAAEGVRNVPAFRYGWPAAVGVLCAIAAVVSIREMARWDKVAAASATAAAAREDEKTQQTRRDIAALTDANSLLEWDSYTGYNVPEDIRTEALRRVAARPRLEAELTEALASENTLWTREVLALIVRLPFTPSAALGKPVRDALAVINGEIRKRATDTDGDRAVDSFEGYTMQQTLKLAQRMAESAGVDLSPSLDDMQQAVAVSRNSNSARTFPAQVADAKRQIAATLAARHK